MTTEQPTTCSHCDTPQGTITAYRMAEEMTICSTCVDKRIELLHLVILEHGGE
jgi:hypothetical protein